MCFKNDPCIRNYNDPIQLAQDIAYTTLNQPTTQDKNKNEAPTAIPPQYTQSTLQPSTAASNFERDVFP